MIDWRKLEKIQKRWDKGNRFNKIVLNLLSFVPFINARFM